MIPLKVRGDSLVIPKKSLPKKGEYALIRMDEYRTLRERAVPTYHLTGKAASDLDKLIIDGMRDYRAGKTRMIQSLADLD